MATHHVANLNSSAVPTTFTQHNHIDLTGDEEDIADDLFQRAAKRARTEASFLQSRPQNSVNPLPIYPHPSYQPQGVSFINSRPPASDTPSHQPLYRPAFVPPPFPPPRPSQPPLSRHTSFSAPSSQSSSSGSSHIIDLTGSPSPPPMSIPLTSKLPPELSPKTPVCIGQLTVTALVLYPVQYINPRNLNGEAEWAPVRLQHEHNPLKHDSETIHIQVPHTRTPNGDIIPGDTFGVVEQKVATSLGPMLGKGLIRLDAKVRRGPPNVPFSLTSTIIVDIHPYFSASNSFPPNARLHSERQHTCGW